MEKNDMASQAFIGRKPQLKVLRSFSRNPERSKITAIYGRRRIGKTRLVREAYRGFRMLDFEGLEGEGSAEQRRHFRNTLYRHTKLEEHRVASASDWTDLLILLMEYIGKEPCVVFFDELQWMAAGRNAFVSKLKFIWDKYSTQRRVHLVICGSVSSFLVKKVIRSRALYGRIDDIIDLGPLEFPEVRSGFFARRHVREALEYYLAFGGVPKYLELYDDSHSVRLNLARLCFKPGSFFSSELERLYVSHFGAVPHYRKIVRMLDAQGFATRTQIAHSLKRSSGGRLSELLEDLCLAGFVDAYSPVQNPDSTYLQRYRIADPFLRFHYRFIHSQQRRIASSSDGLPLHRALPDKKYEVYLGLAFEQFCRQHADLIAHKLGFSAVAYNHGSWFRKPDLATGAQVDLLFKRADKVLTLCEVKHREHVGHQVITDVKKKVIALSAFRNHTVERVLISALPPSREVQDAGYFTRILIADDFANA